MHPVYSRLILVVTIMAFVLLAACTSQTVNSSIPAVTPSTQTPVINSTVLPTQEILPSLVPSTQPLKNNADKQVIQSYHTVLMLGRGADLILTVIAKIDAGEIPKGDPEPRYPYTNALALAIDSYNQTTPPPGALNIGWKTVTSVTQQYMIVYEALNKGNAISNKDYYNLKALRQIMTNYQNDAEKYLRFKGMGDDFFSSQKQAVEQHFKQAYGNQTMPSSTDAVGK